MKILVVEDEPKTSKSIKQGLEEENYTVDVAYDGRFGLRFAQDNAYDLIILDVIIPYMNGIEICSELRKTGNTTPILILTALGSTNDIVLGLDSGADDYMTKPFDIKELLARVRTLLKRSSGTPSTVNMLRIADVEMNLDSRLVKRGGKKIDLTPKESALLEYFIKNKGRVITRAEIAEKVWNIDFDTGTNLIEVYVNYLRNKIDKNFDKKLIHTQFGMGYFIREDA